MDNIIYFTDNTIYDFGPPGIAELPVFKFIETAAGETSQATSPTTRVTYCWSLWLPAAGETSQATSPPVLPQ
jgi:hypothetical protein